MIRVTLPLLLLCAALNAEPSAQQPITTGKEARVEKSLAGGLARFGSNTQAQIQQDGSLKIGQGLSLISSDSGWLRHEAVNIVTAAGKVTVRGTALIAVMVDGSLKITCLEGKVKAHIASGAQELEPGQMLVCAKDGPSAKVQVELASLIQTCVMLGADFKPLSRSSAIARHSERQSKALAKAASRQIPIGPEVVIPGQSNSPGASNMVAVAAAFPNSQVLAGAQASDITYSSYSAASTLSTGSLILRGGSIYDGVSSGSSGLVVGSVTGGSLNLSFSSGAATGSSLNLSSSSGAVIRSFTGGTLSSSTRAVTSTGAGNIMNAGSVTFVGGSVTTSGSLGN
jgi:hypothetical protein